MRVKYIYRPGLMDLLEPTVLRGRPIAAGAEVTVSRKDRPFMLPPIFQVIKDSSGNVQSVFKMALIKK